MGQKSRHGRNLQFSDRQCNFLTDDANLRQHSDRQMPFSDRLGCWCSQFYFCLNFPKTGVFKARISHFWMKVFERKFLDQKQIFGLFLTAKNLRWAIVSCSHAMIPVATKAVMMCIYAVDISPRKLMLAVFKCPWILFDDYSGNPACDFMSLYQAYSHINMLCVLQFYLAMIYMKFFVSAEA